MSWVHWKELRGKCKNDSGMWKERELNRWLRGCIEQMWRVTEGEGDHREDEEKK